MYEDYLTVNKVLEGLFYMGWKHPDWIVKAPDQILISEKKYTLLVSIHAHYGKRNSGIMSFSIINNKDKIIEYIKRSDFSDSLDRFNYIDNPLDVKQIRKRIKAVLKKMIY